MTNLGITLQPRNFRTPAEMVRIGAELEYEGFDHLFVTEGGNDSMTLLAALATATRRAAIGSGIANIYLRHPMEMAMAATVIDNLSEGRLILGLGTAHQVVVEQQLGLDMSRPLSRLREYASTVRDLLDSRDGPVNIKGEHYQVTPSRLVWTPKRHVPIILATLRDGAVKLAGQMADGVILSIATLRQIRRIRRLLNEEAEAWGRTPEDIKIYAIVNTTIRPTRDEARAVLKASVRGYFNMPFYRRVMLENGMQVVDGVMTDHDADRVGVAGPLEYAQERIQEYREAGADVVLLSPGSADPDPISTYRTYMKLLEG